MTATGTGAPGSISAAVEHAAVIAPARLRELARFLGEQYRLDGVSAARQVGSEADETLVIDVAGRPTHVLKIVRDGSLAAVRLQAGLLDHVAAAPGVRTARIVRSADGRTLVPMPAGAHALLTTFCAGAALEDLRPGDGLVADVARALADLQRALADYPGTGVPATHPWALDSLPEHRHLIARHLDADWHPYAERITDAVRDLRGTIRRRQPIHADFNLSNVLSDGDRVTAVIDFGDTVLGPRVHDVAIALAYLQMQQPAAEQRIRDVFLRAYTERHPLPPEDLDCLPTLVAARALLAVLLGRETAAREPRRAGYALRYDQWSLALLGRLRTTVEGGPV